MDNQERNQETSNKGSTEPPKPQGFYDKFFGTLKNHKWDCVAYFILFIGLLLSLFEKFFGTFLVGLIFGVYFSEELSDITVKLKNFFVHEDIFRTFVFVAGLLVLLLSAPGIIIGITAGVLIWHYLGVGPFHHE